MGVIGYDTRVRRMQMLRCLFYFERWLITIRAHPRSYDADNSSLFTQQNPCVSKYVDRFSPSTRYSTYTIHSALSPPLCVKASVTHPTTTWSHPTSSHENNGLHCKIPHLRTSVSLCLPACPRAVAGRRVHPRCPPVKRRLLPSRHSRFQFQLLLGAISSRRHPLPPLAQRSRTRHAPTPIV
jgi:hypothetical protein